MIQAVKFVLDKGVCSLSAVFRAAFPDVTYNTTQAKQQLLAMPLVAIRVESGHSEVKLLELISAIDYKKIEKFLTDHYLQQSSSEPAQMSKAALRQLLSFAQR